MKTRGGFVSNSSSSSFIIIGKPINIKEAIENSNKNIIGILENESGNEVICKLNLDMLKILQEEQETKSDISIKLIDAIFFEPIDEGCSIYKTIGVEIPADNYIYSTTLSDNYPPENVEELKDYLN